MSFPFGPSACSFQEASLLQAILMMEGLGYGCRDNGLTFALNAIMWSLQPTIINFASETQNHARWSVCLIPAIR